MPSWSEVLGNGSIRGQKARGMPRGRKRLHATLPLARRPMRVLTPVIERATLAMLHLWQYRTLRRTVALQLIRNDDPRHVLQSLQQLAEAWLRRVRVAQALHQDIAHIPCVIHRAPQRVACAMDVRASRCASKEAPCCLSTGGCMPALTRTGQAGGEVARSLAGSLSSRKRGCTRGRWPRARCNTCRKLLSRCTSS